MGGLMINLILILTLLVATAGYASDTVIYRQEAELKLKWEPSKPEGSAYGYAVYCEVQGQEGQATCVYVGEDNQCTVSLAHNLTVRYRVRPIGTGERYVVAGVGYCSAWSAWYTWDTPTLRLVNTDAGYWLEWNAGLGQVEIQVSDNLVAWSVLTTCDTGTVRKAVQGPNIYRQKYYRLKVE